jgi:hypothetical protein
MYGLPSDPNIEVLKNESLIQICIGENDLILNFSGNISLAVYSSVGLGQSNNSMTSFTDFIAVSPQLLRLLSRKVLDVKWDKDGTISIKFENNAIVEVYDDSEQFESYTIRMPSGLVVV